MDRRLFLTMLAGLMGACASPKGLLEPDTGKDAGPEVDTVSGTRIREGNNVYGTILDEEGKPVRNVPVTDGFRFVRSDSNGVYQLKADPRSTFVYYSLPAGFAIAQDAGSHLPAFHQRIDPTAVNRRDFVLRRLADASAAFSFAVLGDIHIRDAETAARFRSTAMPAIGRYFRDNASRGPVFGISLGDIINNAKDPETYAMAQGALGSAEYADGQYLPFFTVIGNHDHDSRMGDAANAGADGYDRGTERRYAECFGPTCYSFNVGKVHFVGVDNYISRKGPTSSTTALASQGATGLTDEICNWLVKDLSMVEDKADRMVVVLQHCHVRGFSDIPHREDMLAALASFHSAYIFSGHAHLCETYKYKVLTAGGRPVMERIHGVPMGNFWYSRYNPDGSPAGFYVYRVNGNEFSDWEFRCVHDPEDRMRVYDSNDVYDRESDWSHQYAWRKEALFAEGYFLLAHIYDGNEDWEVSLEHDGRSEKMTFANKRIPDYCVNCHLANDGVAGIRTSWKYHWDSSENWWYIKLDRPASQLTGWKVVAKAKFPGSGETRSYSCDRITRKLGED